MNVINFAIQALYLVLIISLPPIIVASLIGIIVSLLQAITQLQEQTLTFGIKLVAVIITLFFMGTWLSGILLKYSDDIFTRFYLL